MAQAGSASVEITRRIRRKKLTVDFDSGNPSSDAGLLLLRQVEREFGVCRRVAEAMPDRRDPDRIWHAMFEMAMARVAAIACGHKAAIDPTVKPGKLESLDIDDTFCAAQQLEFWNAHHDGRGFASMHILSRRAARRSPPLDSLRPIVPRRPRGPPIDHSDYAILHRSSDREIAQRVLKASAD